MTRDSLGHMSGIDMEIPSEPFDAAVVLNEVLTIVS